VQYATQGLARSARTGVLMILKSMAVKTASKAAANLAFAILDKEPELSAGVVAHTSPLLVVVDRSSGFDDGRPSSAAATRAPSHSWASSQLQPCSVTQRCQAW